MWFLLATAIVFATVVVVTGQLGLEHGLDRILAGSGLAILQVLVSMVVAGVVLRDLSRYPIVVTNGVAFVAAVSWTRRRAPRTSDTGSRRSAGSQTASASRLLKIVTRD